MFEFSAAAVAIPLIAIPAVVLLPGKRAISLAAALLSLISAFVAAATMAPAVTFGDASSPLLIADSFSALLMILFAAMVLVVMSAQPKRDQSARGYVGLLLVLASTLAAYAATTPLILFIAWTVSALPFVFRFWPAEREATSTDRASRIDHVLASRSRVLANESLALLGSCFLLSLICAGLTVRMAGSTLRRMESQSAELSEV